MRALSLWQPWAWAILHAGKRIENRSRADGAKPALCSYRGPLLIHASRSVGTRDDFDDAVEYLIDRGAPSEPHARISSQVAVGHVITRGVYHGEGFWAPSPELARGGIVGRCHVIGHVGPDGRMSNGRFPDVDMRWHVQGSYGLVLADVQPLPFVPWKGEQGLFEVPDSALEGAA